MNLNKYLQPIIIDDGINKKLLYADQTQAKIIELLLRHKDEIDNMYDAELKEMQEQQQQAINNKKLMEDNEKQVNEQKNILKLVFHKLLIDKFGEFNLERSLNDGNCIVCGEWEKHHQYYKDYGISTCCPSDFLKYHEPNNKDDEDNQHEGDEGDEDTEIDEKLRNYEELVNMECANKVRKLLGLENIHDCSNNTNCRENWTRYMR
jgi:hypothetical protein